MQLIAPTPSQTLTSSLLRSHSDPTFDERRPYVSTEYGAYDVNENDKYFFKNGEKIQCRHLATMWLMDGLLHGKVNYGLYKGERISQHVRSDTEKIYEEILKEAEIALIDNNIVGQHFGDMFQRMEARGESELGCFLFSAGHAMSLMLSIKTENGKKKYIVTFYEPNSTGTHVELVHKEFLDLSKLGSLRTKDLLGERRDEIHFGDSNTAELVVVEKELLASTVDKVERGISVERTSKSATVDFTIDTINPMHIFYMMDLGCDQNLEELVPLFEHMKETDPEEFIRLVSAKNTDESFGLRRALGMGHDRAIIAYSKLFRLVPQDQQAKILAMVTSNGIALALHEGHTNAIKAFKELFELIPPDERAAFLAEAADEGIAGALQNGHADAIKAFKELLELVESPDERADLLAKVTNNGVGLALQNGHANAIKAFKELLPPKEQADFLAKVTGKGIASALQKRHIDAIKAFKELFELIPPDERAAFLAEAADEGIALALRNGHADVIKAFKELLELVESPDERADLLAKVTGSGLELALRNGHVDAIKAFKELLNLIESSKKRADLLAIVADYGIALALQGGRVDAIKVFRELLDLIESPKDRTNLLTILTKNKIVGVLADGDVGVIKAFKELLDLVELPEEKAKLLTKVTGNQIVFALHNGHCSGQEISDTSISFFATIFCSKTAGGRLPNTECARSQL